MRAFWSTEHDALIREGLAQGLTGPEIAARLCAAGRPGTTRCAVGGRIWRLENGLDAAHMVRRVRTRAASRPRPRVAKPAAHVAQVATMHAGRKPVAPEVLAGFASYREKMERKRAQILALQHVRLIETGKGQCRRPVAGAGRDTLACGAPTPDGASFCPQCARLMYGPRLRPVYVARGLDSLPAIEVVEERDLVDLLGEAA